MKILQVKHAREQGVLGNKNCVCVWVCVWGYWGTQSCVYVWVLGRKFVGKKAGEREGVEGIVPWEAGGGGGRKRGRSICTLRKFTLLFI